jgi:hypothetical protein
MYNKLAWCIFCFTRWRAGLKGGENIIIGSMDRRVRYLACLGFFKSTICLECTCLFCVVFEAVRW